MLLQTAGNVSTACQMVGITRQCAYYHRNEDADFSAAWDEAIQTVADAMEQEMYRRAVEGVDKPVYQQGALVGHIREYSDTLLIFALKGARPDKYRDRQEIDHKGKLEIEYVNDWRASETA